jgi:hypothetical protein
MVKDLWKRFFDLFLNKNLGADITCVLHNLGNFDDYFVLLGLIE